MQYRAIALVLVCIAAHMIWRLASATDVISDAPLVASKAQLVGLRQAVHSISAAAQSGAASKDIVGSLERPRWRLKAQPAAFLAPVSISRAEWSFALATRSVADQQRF